ncbi:hypothetical protein [Hydrogenophaga atypica]|uniref:Uncharacterized protein n=1 Tax=Hydrogenophaga atypica TaxID=249409 RepID=A0ABW2QRC8_9BURK
MKSVVSHDRIEVLKLTAAQRSKAVKRRKEIWEALHPVIKQRVEVVADAVPVKANELEVGDVFPPQVSGHGGARPQNKSFASSTAAVTGESKRSINQHIARAEALGDDLDKVAGTSLLAKVSVRALRKLQVRAPCVAGFSPFLGRTSRRRLFG